MGPTSPIDRVPARREDRRPGADVPVRHLHHSRDARGPAGHVDPLRLRAQGPAGRPADHRQLFRRGANARRRAPLPAGDRLAPARAARRRRYEVDRALCSAFCRRRRLPRSKRDARADRAARRARCAARPLRAAAAGRRGARDRRLPGAADAAAALPGGRAQQAARRHGPQGRQHADPLRPAGDGDAAGHLDRAASSRACASAPRGRSASASSSAKRFPRWKPTARSVRCEVSEGRYASTLALRGRERQAEERRLALESGAGRASLHGRRARAAAA